MATQKKTANGRVTAKKEKPANPLAALDLLRSKELARSRIDLITKPDLADEVNQITERLQTAQTKFKIAERAHELTPDVSPGPTADVANEIAKLERDLAKARESAADVTITFEFAAVARPVLRDLAKEHEPTDEQRARFKAVLKSQGKPADIPLDINEETYPPHLIAKAMVAVEVNGERFDPFDLETVLTMWHGPLCIECGGTGLDPDEENTVCQAAGCVEGRRPDLGQWSARELEALFVGADAPNKTIPKI